MLLPTLYINCFFLNGIGKFQSKLFGSSTYIFTCKISFFLFLIPILLVDNKIRFIRVFFRKAYFRFSSLPFAYQRYTWNWNVTFFFLQNYVCNLPFNDRWPWNHGKNSSGNKEDTLLGLPNFFFGSGENYCPNFVQLCFTAFSITLIKQFSKIEIRLEQSHWPVLF